VKSIGRREEIVNVSEGYFRNFLAPRQLAVAAVGSALTEWEKRRKNEAAHEEKLRTEAKALAAKLSGIKVTVKGKVGVGSKLYGSITAADIAANLEKQTGIKIDKRKIEMDEPIKTLGSHEIPIKLHRDATTRVNVEVVGE
jgi:large subunit ribosomal protein L9